MSTPIETNTEELQQAVQRVYNLPNIGGSGNAQPDLVIGLSMPIRYIAPTSENTTVTIESGSLLAVAEAFRAGRCPVVKINHHWVTNSFDTSYPIVEIAEYNCTAVYYNGYIHLETMVTPIESLQISLNIDDADYLSVMRYPLSHTSIKVL